MSIDRRAPLVLIGGGGHAKVVVDALRAQGAAVSAYVDPNPSPWLDQAGVARWSDEQLAGKLAAQAQLVMGYLGLTCEALEKRYRQMQGYLKQGAVFPPVVHPSAMVSPASTIGAGAQVLPGAIVGSHAAIGEGAVLNSGALAEHDAVIGAGAHMAPRAVALGGARVGCCAYIGSGAVVVQNASVADKTFVKALTVYK